NHGFLVWDSRYRLALLSFLCPESRIARGERSLDVADGVVRDRDVRDLARNLGNAADAALCERWRRTADSRAQSRDPARQRRLRQVNTRGSASIRLRWRGCRDFAHHPPPLRHGRVTNRVREGSREPAKGADVHFRQHAFREGETPLIAEYRKKT